MKFLIFFVYYDSFVNYSAMHCRNPAGLYCGYSQMDHLDGNTAISTDYPIEVKSVENWNHTFELS